jgi:DNA repair protein RecO (recombination protein O)
MNTDYYHAVILHTKPYKESSIIACVWLKEYGKISAIYYGKKSKKRSNLCQIFCSLQLKIRFSVFHDRLSTIQDIEQEEGYIQGTYLSQLSRFYINELLYWLLPHDHCDKDLFNCYLKSIQNLIDDSVSYILRHFEIKLLTSLGYSFQTEYDNQGNLIKKDSYYLMHPLSAFYISYNPQKAFTGELISKLDRSGDLLTLTKGELKQFRVLTRININACLNGRELKSRTLLSKCTRYR